MKLSVFFLTFLLVALFQISISASVQSQIDSLEYLVSSNIPDEKKLEILNELATIYITVSPEACLKNAGKALKLARKFKNDKEEAKALNSLGNYYRSKNDQESALKCYQSSLTIRKKAGDRKGIAGSMNNLGLLYLSKGNNELALKYYQKSLEIRLELNDKRDIANSYNNIGRVYYTWSYFQKASEYYLKSLKIAEEINDKEEMSYSLGNLGNVYIEMGNYTDAIKYFEKSLQILKSQNNNYGVAMTYSNIGVVYYNQKNYAQAIEYYNESLKIERDLGNKEGQARTMNNIGIAYEDWKKYDKALEYYQKTLDLCLELDNKYGIALSYNGIGNIYRKWGKYTEAIEYYNKNLEIVKKLNLSKSIINTYQDLSKAHSSTGNFQKAYEYSNMCLELKDSVYSNESQKQIAEMQTKYETEKKEKEIELLNKDKELKESELKKQRILALTFIAGFVIVLIFTVLLIKQVNQKKKANILLEKKNKEISDSIHYARRIQTAILPPENVMESLLPDHFILAKPRDIVSGDFYWIKCIETNHQPEEGRSDLCLQKHLIFCVADCTGHGVPGAFMSMLGITLLNEIVNKISVETRHASSLQAGEILDRLRNGVIKSLHQTGVEGDTSTGSVSGIQDGMDIALCILNSTPRPPKGGDGKSPLGDSCLLAGTVGVMYELQFAGANNPLYIVETRQASSLQNTLVEIRPDKMPISIYSRMDPFTTQNIGISKGDMIYLCSDGYTDQFGSLASGGKKFKNKKFKELLVKISDRPIPEQKEALDSAFMEWKGEAAQVDDILVIGIRV